MPWYMTFSVMVGVAPGTKKRMKQKHLTSLQIGCLRIKKPPEGLNLTFGGYNPSIPLVSPRDGITTHWDVIKLGEPELANKHALDKR